MSVRAEPKVRWREVRQRAVAEQDPNRLLSTIQELIEILEKSETGSQMRFAAADR